MFFIPAEFITYLFWNDYFASNRTDDYHLTMSRADYRIDFIYDHMTVYYWHDGDELRAADWIEHSERIRIPDSLPQFKALMYALGLIESIETWN